MKNKKLIVLSVINAIILINNGCTKSFLDAKPSTEIVQPTTLDDFQRLLDNTEVINKTTALGILAADEYAFSSDAIWESARSATDRNSYIWAKDIYQGEASEHWSLPYSAIFYANNVLEGLEKVAINPLNTEQWNYTRGWALFARAFANYELVNNFALPYDATTASKDLGIPLRLKASVDELLPRATVEQTYDRIFTDLVTATTLLTPELPATRTRPSKVAAHALFARIYLNMRNYQQSELHADTCLSLYKRLIDYNTISKTATTPFGRNHDEQIYAKGTVSNATYATTGANAYIQVSQNLIDLYSLNDLRLSIYYNKQANGTYDFKRGYQGSGVYPFAGLATDEVFLIKAECLARRGEIGKSMEILNQLLINRWNPAATVPAKAYINLTASDATDALAKVLLERKKELVWRGLRWDDLKRFNKENANITLTRSVKGVTYTLEPNSPRYVFPIPDNEINSSGITQNLR